MTLHPTQPRDPFFRGKHFQGTFQTCGRTFELDLRTPDLTALPTRTWGDWGPMHTCELPPDRHFTVSYRCTQTGHTTRHRLSPPTVLVGSPARVDQREQTPLYVEVDDLTLGLRIRGYLDRDGEPAGLEVEPLMAGLDVPARMFRATAALEA